MIEDDVPEGRCGFVLEPGDVNEHIAERYEAGSDGWYKEWEIACCWREVWKGEDTDRCIWHAEVDEKPPEELIAAREAGPERLDGVYLRETHLKDSISFEECRIRCADLRDGDLRFANFRFADLWLSKFTGSNLPEADFEGANLPVSFGEVNLYNAVLRSANLHGTDFRGGSLIEADFEDAYLHNANFESAVLFSANLKDANLWNADLVSADLGKADLRGANIKEADLSAADLRNADLESANFRKADFSDANLADADLTDANLRNADLKAATLEDAVLARTDLRGADLEYAELYQTLFSDIRMNNRTEFGETCQYEARDIEPQIGGDDSDVTPLEAAAWTYRRIQTLHEENALAQDAREYHVKKAEAYRKLRWREFVDVWSRPHRDPWIWLTTFVRATTYSANRWLSRHGESPHRVVGVSLLVILASAVLYPLVGGIKHPPTPDETPTVIAFDLLPSIPIPLPGPIADLATSLYFSVVTFTTLGYGDLQPASGAAQALATVESFTGALLMALLVFVLGRRATW